MHTTRHPLFKLAGLGAAAGLMVILGAAGVIAAVIPAGSTPAAGSGSVPGMAVPIDWRLIEAQAASSCPSLSWAVLGALGWLASESGRQQGSSASGWPTTRAGAFGIVLAGELGGDPTVAAQASQTADLLCATAKSTGSFEAALLKILGEPKLVMEINVVATSLAAAPDLSASRAQVVTFAAGALGLPYQWGGNGPETYDCSGLVVAAMRAAGIQVPRTAQDQHDVATSVTGADQPGDLVFFGAGSSDVTHVGIEIGEQLMIDAPETGAVVRIEDERWSDLVSRGSVAP
jgi:cell wall-associated NlpC family hydrolase